MEIKVHIDKATIDSNTETTISTSDILTAGRALSCTSAPIYVGFYKKLVSLVKDRKFVEYKHTTTASGENVSWITIFSNSATSNLFDLFKSMGIYTPKLTIGVDTVTNTVYTTSKLCRDLNKYSEQQRAAVLMYMLSIAHFVIMTEQLLVSYEYDGLTGTLKTSSDADTFIKTIRQFAEEETWYIKDNNNDNYNTVKFYNGAHTSTNDLYANGNAVKLGVVRHKSGGVAGIATVALGTTKYTFVVSEKTAYTDFDLCNIEISSDSVCAFIANAFPGNVYLQKVSKLPLTKDMEFLEFDGESLSEFIKSEKIPKWLAGWLMHAYSKNATTADFEDLEHLCKAYGIKLPAGTLSTAGVSFDDMRNMYKSDEYAQELYKQIKPYYDSYSLGDDLNTNLKGFSNGALYSMVFVGESGTGKSTAARVIPARCGIPYISVNFSVNIEEADLFGSMIPNAKKSSPEDPEFVWSDGIITKAVRNGYCVILEEINFARPGVLGKLNSLLDENRQVDLSTGEIVRAHPNFRIIATCNIAYEGTNRFNKALINRFDDVTIFKDLERNEAINVIKNRTGYTSTVKIAKVYDVYEALKKFATEQNVNAIVSMRQLLNIFTKGKYYSSAKDAVQRIMINGAFIEDSEYQKVFEETVFTAFDLKFKI